MSALATVGALLLVALMCFWGCYLYKRLGKNDGKGLAVDVSGGADLTPILAKSNFAAIVLLFFLYYFSRKKSDHISF